MNKSNKKILKNSFKNILEQYDVHLFYLFLCILSLHYWFNYKQEILMIFSIATAILLLPGIFLHIHYLYYNMGEEYEIYFDKIIQSKKGVKTTYNNHQISKIIIYLPFKIWNEKDFIQSMVVTAAEKYNYSVVRLKNGEDLILTCTLCPRIDKELEKIEGVPIEKRKRWICIIRKEKD